jgi:hypothetical protein
MKGSTKATNAFSRGKAEKLSIRAICDFSLRNVGKSGSQIGCSSSKVTCFGLTPHHNTCLPKNKTPRKWLKQSPKASLSSGTRRKTVLPFRGGDFFRRGDGGIEENVDKTN